jgi:AcrR family transcriptional regulator
MVRKISRASPHVRRVEILGAARGCFSEAGYHRTRVDEIAERAGLSKGSVYWHFAGKREIFLALFDRQLEELLAYRHVPSSRPWPASGSRSSTWLPRIGTKR